MAVVLQLLAVGVAVLVQVHVAAFDDGEQMPRLDAKMRRMRHQRLHHGVAGAACKSLLHFMRPPAQLGGCQFGLRYFVHNIIHLAAKGIERSNGCALLGGQKQKSVIKAAACRNGFFLYIRLRRNSL